MSGRILRLNQLRIGILCTSRCAICIGRQLSGTMITHAETTTSISLAIPTIGAHLIR
jgi:hypothetical protein